MRPVHKSGRLYAPLRSALVPSDGAVKLTQTATEPGPPGPSTFNSRRSQCPHRTVLTDRPTTRLGRRTTRPGRRQSRPLDRRTRPGHRTTDPLASGAGMMNWPDRYPGRLEYELASFERRGLDFRLDEAHYQRSGQVVVRAQLPHDGQVVDLEVVYPDFFPLFRPQVFATELRLGRHQNPVTGNLCLLDRPTRAWHTNHTGAWLVAERVPHLLLLLEQDSEVMARAEVPQGEPASAFLPYHQPGAMLAVPWTALALPAEHHRGAAQLTFSSTDAKTVTMRVLLAKVCTDDAGASPLAEADEPLRQRFGGRALDVRWVRLPESPVADSAEALLRLARKQDPELGMATWHRLADRWEVRPTAIVFQEEVGQQVIDDGWLLLVEARHGSGKNRRSATYIARGERLSRRDLQERIPHLAGLESKTVCLAGLGSLGSPLAVELARAGVGRLRVLDYDHVETGTSVRWARGLSATAHLKTAAVAALISTDHPYTRVEQFDVQLGSADRRNGHAPTEHEALHNFLDGADLVIDATAELAIGHLISVLAADHAVPQLYVSATDGAWGGRVARLLPGRTGCWMCLQHRIDDHTLPTPPYEPSGTVQPRGCAARTFTGANFDLQPLVSQAARVATHTLLRETDEAQQTPWPAVHICALHGEHGPLPAPAWSSHELSQDPACPTCAGGE